MDRNVALQMNFRVEFQTHKYNFAKGWTEDEYFFLKSKLSQLKAESKNTKASIKSFICNFNYDDYCTTEYVAFSVCRIYISH